MSVMHNAERQALDAPWKNAISAVFPPTLEENDRSIPLADSDRTEVALGPQVDSHSTLGMGRESVRSLASAGYRDGWSHETLLSMKRGSGRLKPGGRLIRSVSSTTSVFSGARRMITGGKRAKTHKPSLQNSPSVGSMSHQRSLIHHDQVDFSRPVVPQQNYHDIVTMRETESFLNRQTSTRLLDLSGDTKVSNPVLWQTAIRLAKECKSVKLRANANLDDLMMRSLALCLGDELEAIDAASCPTVNDGVVQSLVIRLFNLRYINLSGCKMVTNVSLKALADGCKDTLTSVDVSRCPSIGDPGIAWLAGQVGAGDSCKKLASLNLEECTKIRDRALEDLGLGCQALRFVNFRGCKEISNRGVQALAKGCAELRVINIHSCIKVGDPSLVMIGKSCKELQSLCATRCLLITDRGLTAIGRGCPSLQSITLAGCVKITEGGVCAIAENCRGLQTLNVTGCIDITENGLKELLRGLPFVETARTYVGFRPKGATQSEVRHLRLSVQQKAVLDAAAARVQAAFVSYRQRKLFEAARHANVMFKTCVRIQRLARGARARLRVRRIRIQRHREANAKIIQEWFKEVKERLAAWRLKQSRAIYKTQVGAIRKMQANYRGILARRKYPDVVRVIQALRKERWVEAEEALAVRLQGIVRMHRARRIMKAMAEEVYQRQRDEDWAAREIERVCRGHLGRQQAYYARRELRKRYECAQMRVSWAIAPNSGIVKIQSMVRSKHLRMRRAGYRLRGLWAVQVDRINAVTIQCAWRSYVSRCLLVVLKRDKIIMTKAVLKLQRIYRGHKIKDWRALKFDMLRNRVRGRYELDAIRSQKVVDAKLKIVQDKRDNDSCSDSDEEDDEWKEYIDYDGTPFVFSAARNERRDNKPTKEGWAFTLVGRRVRIYWPFEDRKYEAWLTKYHLRKNKWRAEYDDGEHEWIDLRQEQDRIQIKESFPGSDDQWIDFRHCRDPAKSKGFKVRTALRMEGGREEDEEDINARQQLETAAGRNGDDGGTGEYGDLEGEWIEYIDYTTLEPYYVHSITGETRMNLEDI